MPEPANAQAFNRYSYVFNNPLNYVDPSGYDPLDEEWERQFRAAHGTDPTDQDRQDRIFSLLFPGSGENGIWTDADWDLYLANRSEYLRHPEHWSGGQAPGLSGFQDQVNQLLTFYGPDEEEQFVRAFGLIFGGIPYDTDPYSAAFAVAFGPALSTLYEGTTGFDPQLTDTFTRDFNPAHHYAGLFYLGYYTPAKMAMAVNFVRDVARPYNPQDILLGDIAIADGNRVFHKPGGHYLVPDMLGKLNKYEPPVSPFVYIQPIMFGLTW